MNDWVGLGYLAKDPELGYYGEGKNQNAICKFTVAIPKKINRNKEGKSNVNWVKCVAFGKTAEAIEKFFKKGNRILVRGELDTNEYYDELHKFRQHVKAIVQEFNYIDRKGDNGNSVEIGDNEIYLADFGKDALDLPDRIF